MLSFVADLIAKEDVTRVIRCSRHLRQHHDAMLTIFQSKKLELNYRTGHWPTFMIHFFHFYFSLVPTVTCSFVFVYVCL